MIAPLAFFPIVFAVLMAACSKPEPDAPAALRVPAAASEGLAVKAGGAPAPKAAAERAQEGLPTTTLTFPGGAAITVDVADTPRTREKGLMFRRDLAPDCGMLFVFSEEQMLQFWMKDTLVSLDMVWLDGERRVTGVHPDVPASREDTPEDAVARRTGTGKFVLELPAGQAARRGLKPGARLRFSWREVSQ